MSWGVLAGWSWKDLVGIRATGVCIRAQHRVEINMAAEWQYLLSEGTIESGRRAVTSKRNTDNTTLGHDSASSFRFLHCKRWQYQTSQKEVLANESRRDEYEPNTISEQEEHSRSFIKTLQIWNSIVPTGKLRFLNHFLTQIRTKVQVQLCDPKQSGLYSTLQIFHGSTVAQWRNAGYQNQPEHAAFAALLKVPQEDADAIIRDRFPVPRLVDCDQHGSQVRRSSLVLPKFGHPFNGGYLQ